MNAESNSPELVKLPVSLTAGEVELAGDLAIPPGATGLVLFAHGSGSSRFSPRNRFVAAELNRGGLATLLFDLLTEPEERIDSVTRELRFDIPLLAGRLTAAVDWAAASETAAGFRLGCFGASTGAAAALLAAAARPGLVRAVVSRGGRPDLAGPALRRVASPTLLIVGEFDQQVLELNRQALALLPNEGTSKIEVVPGATHLFEEPGTLEQAAALARSWFRQHLMKT